MKLVAIAIVGLLGLVLCSADSPTQKPSEPCTAGQTYEEDCNTCRCLADTGKFVCTRRACYHGPQFPDTPARKRRSDPAGANSPATKKPTEPCTAGQTYEEDCNTCRCLADTGKFVCTRRACYHGPQFPDTPVRGRRSETPSNQKPPEPCTEGQTYKEDCNTCHCIAKIGKFACTRMACPPEPFKPRKRRSDPAGANSPAIKKPTEPCTAGQTYEEDCNTCRCLADTGKFVCTRRACYHGPQFPDTPARKRRSDHIHADTPADQKPSEPCTEGQTYKEDCNTCRCVASTGKFACTRMACYHGPQFPDTPVKTRREVNASIGKYDLPAREHPNFLAFDVERCEPNEVKNKGCNRCKCTKNGKGWLCTRKACPPETA